MTEQQVTAPVHPQNKPSCLQPRYQRGFNTELSFPQSPCRVWDLGTAELPPPELTWWDRSRALPCCGSSGAKHTGQLSSWAGKALGIKPGTAETLGNAEQGFPWDRNSSTAGCSPLTEEHRSDISSVLSLVPTPHCTNTFFSKGSA